MQLMFDPVDVAFDVETVMQVPSDLKRNATVRDVIKANPKASKRVEKLMNDLQARTGIPMRHNIELKDPQGQRIEPATKRIVSNASQSVLQQNQARNQQRQREQRRQQNQHHNIEEVSHTTSQGGGLANIARGNFNPYDPMSSVGFNAYQNTGFAPEDLNQIQTNLSFGARPVTQADRNRMRQASYQAQQNQAGMIELAQN